MAENRNWTRDVAISSFEGAGEHAEILKLLEAAERRDLFLNVGYSTRGQRHWSIRAQQRLVDRLASRLVRKSKLERRILDIGSGRGGPAIRLHQKWEMDVTGIDPSDRNLELSRRKVRDMTIQEGLLFRKGRAEHLPFSDAEFPFAIAIESLAYVEDKAGSLAEVRRVLQPGGRLAMAALLKDPDAVARSSQNHELYHNFLESWDFADLPSIDDYETMTSGAGLEIIQIEISTKQTLERHTKRLARLMSAWNAGLLYRLSRSYISRKTDADLDLIRPQLDTTLVALKAGILSYGLIWAEAPTTQPGISEHS